MVNICFAYSLESRRVANPDSHDPPPAGQDLQGLLHMAVRQHDVAAIEKAGVRRGLSRQPFEGVALSLDLEAIHARADHNNVGTFIRSAAPRTHRWPQLVWGWRRQGPPAAETPGRPIPLATHDSAPRNDRAPARGRPTGRIVREHAFEVTRWGRQTTSAQVRGGGRTQPDRLPQVINLAHQEAGADRHGSPCYGPLGLSGQGSATDSVDTAMIAILAGAERTASQQAMG